MELKSLEDLRRNGFRDPRELDRFLEENSFPLLSGSQATFAYRGEADEVLLRHWIYGLPAEQPFERVRGTDVWLLSIEMPEGSRVEYKLEVAQGDQRRLIQDPLNPHLAADPYGANSVVHATGYEEPWWAVADPEARPGEIQELRFVSDVFRGPRPLSVYLPARFREDKRYPLVVMHDGSDFLRFTELKTVLDNLIHRLEIPPLIVALTDSPNRLEEYADSEAHGRFLAHELLPVLEQRFPLLEGPASKALAGASFGAVASLSAAWRHPGVFGRLLLLSGSFAFTDIGEDHGRGPVFDPVVRFVNAFRKDPGKPAQSVYLACGTYESLIYYNRSMLPLLQGTGMSVKYTEARDGHNWENWRDRLREGMSWLFPGPLWMVYE